MEPSYKRCQTLGWLGRCLFSQGRLEAAEARYRQALAVAQQLETSEWVQRQSSTLQTDLAYVLMDKGDYAGARAAYAAALAIDEELGNLTGAAVVNLQLGILARRQNDLPEAERHFQEAVAASQWPGEPAMEAHGWHNLGNVYLDAHQWDAAERAYRKAAHIREFLGDLAVAASTWNQLAMVTEFAGKPAEAEDWYRKAIAGSKQAGDQVHASTRLSNLADLLQNQPGRLAEARQWAEEALAIQQTLDPAAVQIWKTYNILADIAAQEGQVEQSRDYRRLEREAYAGFAGAWYVLRGLAPLIEEVVATMADPAQRTALEVAWLDEISKPGWGNHLVTAIRRLLDGEHDEEALCEGLRHDAWLIVHAILREIAEPGSLKTLLADPSQNHEL